MRKFLYILLVFSCIIVLTLFWYFPNYKKNKDANSSNKFIFNSQLSKWEKAHDIKDPIKTDRKTILETNNNKDGLHNKTVFRGYFDSYDEQKQQIAIKALVEFSQGLFEIIEFKLSPNQIIYCAPEVYIDPNNGEAHSLKELVFPVKTGSMLWIPTERVISFNNFQSKVKETTLLYIQLTKDYDSKDLNYIQKIIVIGLCE